MKFRARPVLVALLAAGLSSASLACLNTYAQLRLQGRFSMDMVRGPMLGTLLQHPEKMDQEERDWIRRVTEVARKQPTFEHRNDLGVALVHQGKARQAITLFEALEQRHPGRYETAANLGTAYELAGDAGKAANWIREGIRRNPKSHEGSEWLHLAILDAKLKRRPQGTAERSLLLLDFGDGPLPKVPANLPTGNDGNPVTVRELGFGLRYQLIERVHFVAAPDPTVAALLADLAHLEVAAGELENATMVYHVALKYGYPRTPMLEAGMAEARRTHTPEELRVRDERCQLCPRPQDQ